jgi:hypothetical protein
MRRLARRHTGAIAVAVLVLAVAAQAVADTWTLRLKRRQSNPTYFDRESYVYWSTYPQYFQMQIGPENSPVRFETPDQAAFKRIVKKEPKYVSKHPFRGVAKLGSQQYAFALDTSAPAQPEAKPEKEKGKTKATKSEESALAKLTGKLAKVAPPTKLAPYDRLYFDFNRNGDLTDDGVIKTEGKAAVQSFANGSYCSFNFPCIDVTIDIDGTKLDYAFFLNGYLNVSSEYGYAGLQLHSAVCREGDITLEGKKRHVVLIDFNSNGRFDDEMKIARNVLVARGQANPVYPEQGDMLLVDPKVGMQFDSPYDVTASDYRHAVGKLVNIDGHFYEMKVSPAGDKLTLTPSSVPLGSVTNRNGSFRAMLYGERGFLAIRGDKDKPALVPAGTWKLLNYTITATATPEPAKPAEKKPGEKKGQKSDSALSALTGTLSALFGGSGGAAVPYRPRVSVVAAQATADCKAIKVEKGKTVEFPFGPPYTPHVTIPPYRMQPGGVALEMALIGSAGEICSNIMVDGGRPAKPAFTITDPKGHVVQEGNFEYG